MTEPESPARSRALPVLAVDLDGTLLRGDSLHEAVVQLAFSRPLALAAAALRGVRGKAAFKMALAERCVPGPAALPWDERVVALVAGARADGRRVALVTGAAAPVAQAVAVYMGIAEVLCTTAERNLTGRAKREALDARYGAGAWDYLGNSERDIPVWQGAAHALAANAPAGMLAAARRAGCEPEVLVPREPVTLLDWLRALRVHQWSKNLLVLLPALLAHRATLAADLALSAWALAAFSLVASSIYLINDLADAASDRAHATKRRRPIAEGRIPLTHALAAVPLLLAAGAAMAARLPLAFAAVLAGYVLLSVLYSALLKRLVVVDVIVLAALYTIRLVAGGAATGVVLSEWLAAFALFAFLSLALAKRVGELALMPAERESVAGRGYRRADLEALTALGSAAAYTAVLVFALYLQAPETRVLYSRQAVLWAIVPLLVYWLSRLWLLLRRGEVHEDPVLFALRDPASWIAAAAVAALGVLAR